METLKPHAVTAPEQCDDETDNADLIRLFRKYGTDKLVNGYTHLYHTLFHERRERVRDFLEMDIGTMIEGVASSMVGYVSDSYTPGGSLRACVTTSERQDRRRGRPTRHAVPGHPHRDTPLRFDGRRCGGPCAGRTGRFPDHHRFTAPTSTSTSRNAAQHVPRLDVDGLYIIEDIYPGAA